MKYIGHKFSSVAVILLVVSSATSITLQNNDKHNGDRVQNDERATIWHVRSNGCSLGNNPPPGTNC